jgi:hypothetical protein
MENAPYLNIAGNNVPPEIAEKFYRWYDEVYGALWIKIPGVVGIDRYQIAQNNFDYPGNISLYHHENRKAAENYNNDETRLNLKKDQQATFYRIQRVWHDYYVSIGSFRKDPLPKESTIVDGAPLIHIEGYKLAPENLDKYDQWFLRWASRIYIPILLKCPGLKACNWFKLSDVSPRWNDTKYVATEIAPYISIWYFESNEAFQNYAASHEYAAFKRILELEFASCLTTIWNVEYSLVKSWRK